MTPDRRRFLAGTGAALAGALAGCTGMIFGDGLEFSASTARVSDAALEETGYAEGTVGEEHGITREFSVGDVSREVTLNNRHSEYDRSIEIEGIGEFEGAVFGVFSTPKVEIDAADETLNPIDDMDTDEIVEMVQENYEGVENMEAAGEYDVTVLGEETTAAEYEADAEVAETGESIDLSLHVTEAVGSGDDFVLCFGAYPSPDVGALVGEDDNVRTLMRGVEHDG